MKISSEGEKLPQKIVINFISPNSKTSAVITFLSFIAVVLLCNIPISKAQTPPKLMKLAVIAPEGTSWSEVGQKIKKSIEDKSKGEVKIIWYFGAVMGDEPDVIRKIKLRQLQGGGFTIMGLGLIEPALKILELPFLLEDYQQVDYVLEKMRPTFERLFSQQGFVLAGFIDVGFVYIFSNRPIKNLADLGDFKMWTWTGEPVAEIFLRRAGFKNIIPTPLPETLTALQTGMIDSFYNPLYAAVGLQWYTQARYISNFTFGYTPAAILLDKKFFENLLPIHQKIILDSFNQFLPELTRIVREDNEKAYRAFLEKGLICYPTPPQTIAELKERILPLRSELAGKYYPDWFLQEILETLNEFKREEKIKNTS